MWYLTFIEGLWYTPEEESDLKDHPARNSIVMWDAVQQFSDIMGQRWQSIVIHVGASFIEEYQTYRYGSERDFLHQRVTVRKTGVGRTGHRALGGLASVLLTHGGSAVSRARDSAVEDVSRGRAPAGCQNQPAQGVQEDQRLVTYYSTVPCLPTGC